VTRELGEVVLEVETPPEPPAPGERRRRPWLVALVTVAAVAVLAVAALLVVPSAGVPTWPDGVPGAVIGGGPTAAGRTLEVVDHAAEHGPWSVLVRRRGTGLADGSILVTYPASSTFGERVVRDGIELVTRPELVVRPTEGGFVKVHGDAPTDVLQVLAAGVTVGNDGRPTVDPPSGYVVLATGPYHSARGRTARYGAAEVGEAILGGLVFVGVESGASFLDELLWSSEPAGFAIDGHPAVVSAALANGVVAWELEPGVIAYAGWSGNPMSDETREAIRRVAERFEVLDDRAWAETDPQVSDDVPASATSLP
jgi:hypothetical protein